VAATCGYAAAQTAPENLQLVGADALLTRTVDSKTAAQGQQVTAKLTSNVKGAGMVELPKGTMLIGKVEQVQTSTNKGPSRLSIVFDQAQLGNGQAIPIKATLLGAYPADTGEYYVETGTDGSLLAGLPHKISPAEQIDQEPGTLSHVAMHSSVQSDASAVFTSTDRNVNLKGGTRLQMAIAPVGATTRQSGS
jgi:hypothetical protein